MQQQPQPQDQAQPHTEATTDPRFHASNIKRMLLNVQAHARSDTQQVNDPQARALFETTAEVLGGLAKAYDDYEQGAPAWR
jgi:hypothetical protein